MNNEVPTAFPWTHDNVTCTGMTLRDYFAVRASEEDIKNFSWGEGEEISGIDTLGVKWKRHEVLYFTREQARYRYADEMIKVRGNV